MDLGTVKRRIGQGSYTTPEHAWAEICLVRSPGQALCGGDCEMESTPGVLEMQGSGVRPGTSKRHAPSHIQPEARSAALMVADHQGKGRRLMGAAAQTILDEQALRPLMQQPGLLQAAKPPVASMRQLRMTGQMAGHVHGP